jgi:hypothetical protein
MNMNLILRIIKLKPAKCKPYVVGMLLDINKSIYDTGEKFNINIDSED